MDLLKELGIEEVNYGACSGPDEWSKTTNAGKIDSINPANEEVIASVYLASEKDYERIVQKSTEVFKEWRMLPAPNRGELVRLIGLELRKKKDLLGSLVSLEMGKIKPEGNGEV